MIMNMLDAREMNMLEPGVWAHLLQRALPDFIELKVGCTCLLSDGCLIDSGKKKAHKQKRFGPVALGTTPAPVCPRDKPRLS